MAAKQYPPSPVQAMGLSKHGTLPDCRFLFSSDRNSCGQNCNVTRLCSDFRGKGGWIIFVVVPPPDTNILLATVVDDS